MKKYILGLFLVSALSVFTACQNLASVPDAPAADTTDKKEEKKVLTLDEIETRNKTLVPSLFYNTIYDLSERTFDSIPMTVKYWFDIQNQKVCDLTQSETKSKHFASESVSYSYRYFVFTDEDLKEHGIVLVSNTCRYFWLPMQYVVQSDGSMYWYIMESGIKGLGSKKIHAVPEEKVYYSAASSGSGSSSSGNSGSSSGSSSIKLSGNSYTYKSGSITYTLTFNSDGTFSRKKSNVSTTTDGTWSLTSTASATKLKLNLTASGTEVEEEFNVSESDSSITLYYLGEGTFSSVLYALYNSMVSQITLNK